MSETEHFVLTGKPVMSEYFLAGTNDGGASILLSGIEMKSHQAS
jgi:hypothetical protein